MSDVRTNMLAQARESVAHIIGGHRPADADAIASLVVAVYDKLTAACNDMAAPLDLENLGVHELDAEMQRRAQAFMTTATVGMSMLVMDALIIAVRGRQRTQ